MNAIEFKGVSKKFKKGEKFDSLRDLVPNMVKIIFQGNGKQNGELKDKEFWALKDLSFEVKKGEVLGIIGPNGAGKSTILKLLSKILKPTNGEIKINGKLSALIEVGAGFHEDLTGRENIYLNGAIMGMKKREINERFDEIVGFSELEEFIDTPVKRYSSGMYARLGFSVAAHLDPDVLLVDEVLSVGDMCFQAKCMEKIKNMKVSGTTIVFISHNMEAVLGTCSKAMLLNKGLVTAEGQTEIVVKKYQQGTSYKSDVSEIAHRKNSIVEIKEVSFRDKSGKVRHAFKQGDTIIIRATLGATKKLFNPDFGIAFYDEKGTCLYGHHSKVDKYEIGDVYGTFQVEVEYPNIDFQPGNYLIYFGIYDSQGLKPYEYVDRQYGFTVHGNKGETGLIHLPHFWRIGQEVVL